MQKLIERYRRWREKERLIAELHNFTDKELADMGIDRGMIREAVEGVDKYE